MTYIPLCHFSGWNKIIMS